MLGSDLGPRRLSVYLSIEQANSMKKKLFPFMLVTVTWRFRTNRQDGTDKIILFMMSTVSSLCDKAMLGGQRKNLQNLNLSIIPTATSFRQYIGAAIIPVIPDFRVVPASLVVLAFQSFWLPGLTSFPHILSFLRSFRSKLS
jgi:hypothetical protein